MYKLPHTETPPAAWSALTPPEVVQAVSDGSGRIDAMVEIAAADGSFDLIVDGNH